MIPERFPNVPQTIMNDGRPNARSQKRPTNPPRMLSERPRNSRKLHENTNMPEVNNALDLLQSSLSGRTDVHELFAQEYVGEDDEDGNKIYHKFAFQDLN